MAIVCFVLTGILLLYLGYWMGMAIGFWFVYCFERKLKCAPFYLWFWTVRSYHPYFTYIFVALCIVDLYFLNLILNPFAYLISLVSILILTLVSSFLVVLNEKRKIAKSKKNKN